MVGRGVSETMRTSAQTAFAHRGAYVSKSHVLVRRAPAEATSRCAGGPAYRGRWKSAIFRILMAKVLRLNVEVPQGHHVGSSWRFSAVRVKGVIVTALIANCSAYRTSNRNVG